MSTGRPDRPRWGASRSGVYRAPDARGLGAADAPGLDVVPISLAGVGSKEALLERFAAALAFPDWFGGNWDALEDCLGDLSWRADAGRLLVIQGFEPLQARAHDDFRVLLDVLGDVAQDCAHQGRAFFVVLVDPEGRVALPALNDAAA
jgi:RNAse (barnase) inhibitor barstar